eukprot:752723-Hanusia_phi.AAC.1
MNDGTTGTTAIIPEQRARCTLKRVQQGQNRPGKYTMMKELGKRCEMMSSDNQDQPCACHVI